MRALLVGGFEFSGHDAISEALYEAGKKLNIDITDLRWKDIVPGLEDHPVFHVHRIAAGQGASELAAIMDESSLWDSLATDLAKYLDIEEYDPIISVHPWSTYILAQKIKGKRWSKKLIDVNVDFARFPIFTSPEITGYFGAGPIKPLQARYRRRCHRVGVPVRNQFLQTKQDTRTDSLIVSGGSDGFSAAQLSRVIPKVVKAVHPEAIILLAPTKTSNEFWKKYVRRSGLSCDIVVGLRDISQLLRRSKWILTKASGPGLAEAFVAGCEIFLADSGVFWEAEAREYLALCGAAIPVGVEDSDEDIQKRLLEGAPNRDLFSSQCASAAVDIWELVLEGLPQQTVNSNEIEAVNQIRSRLSHNKLNKILSQTSQVLESLLDDWIDSR